MRQFYKLSAASGRHHASLLMASALSTLTFGACLQPLDSEAAGGGAAADLEGGIAAAFPVNLETPEISGTIDPESGETTSVVATACDKVLADSIEIRKRTCEKCHEGDGSLGAPLNHILDDDQMIGVMADPSSFPGWKYIVPGDPENSLVYHRAAVIQDMPRKGSDVTIVNAGLSISDMSVLHAWIMCLGPAPAGAGSTDGSGMTDADAGAGGETDAGAGGETDAGTVPRVDAGTPDAAADAAAPARLNIRGN